MTTVLTAGQLRAHAQTLEALASRVLAALADGNYGPETVVTEEFLRGLGIALPPISVIDDAAQAILWLNKFVVQQLDRLVAQRVRLVSDGHGDLVPSTDSRVMPDGSLRAYDPAIDGR